MLRVCSVSASRLPAKPYDFGFARETPLTDEDAGLIESRFTADFVLRF